MGSIHWIIFLSIGSHNSSSPIEKIASDNESFRSNDSIFSDESTSSSSKRTNRKVPRIRKAKLTAPSVFGDTSNVFNTPAPIVPIPRPVAAKPPQKSQYNARETDSNYKSAMQRLQVFDRIDS